MLNFEIVNFMYARCFNFKTYFKGFISTIIQKQNIILSEINVNSVTELTIENCLQICESVGFNCRVLLNIRLDSLKGCLYSIFYIVSFSFAQTFFFLVVPLPAGEVHLYFQVSFVFVFKHLHNYVAMLYVDVKTVT